MPALNRPERLIANAEKRKGKTTTILETQVNWDGAKNLASTLEELSATMPSVKVPVSKRSKCDALAALDFRPVEREFRWDGDAENGLLGPEPSPKKVRHCPDRQVEPDDDDWAHHPDLHGAYNPQAEAHKLRVQELQQAHPRGKKADKPNVTEDEAARIGMARQEERAENNKRTKWVWDRIMGTQY